MSSLRCWWDTHVTKREELFLSSPQHTRQPRLRLFTQLANWQSQESGPYLLPKSMLLTAMPYSPMILCLRKQSCSPDFLPPEAWMCLSWGNHAGGWGHWASKARQCYSQSLPSHTCLCLNRWQQSHRAPEEDMEQEKKKKKKGGSSGHW